MRDGPLYGLMYRIAPLIAAVTAFTSLLPSFPSFPLHTAADKSCFSLSLSGSPPFIAYKATAQGFRRDDAHDHDRSQAPWRPHRAYLGAAYLGLGARAPSAYPHDRARRRSLARRQGLGLLPATLLAPGEGPLAFVSPVGPDQAARGP